MPVATRIPIVSALVLALALVAPAASAQEADEDRSTTDVAFYGHVFATGLDAPMPTNTQFPYGEDNLGLGQFDWCTSVAWVNLIGDLPEVDPSRNCDTDPSNKVVLFSTAGPVDIGSRDEFFGGGGYVQFHNERGSTKDIVLDRTKKASASLFMSLDIHAWSVGQGVGQAVFPPSTTYCYYPNPPDTGCLYPYWGWDPAHWPDWVVKASVYHATFGDYGSGASEQIPIRDVIESGQATLVATGQVGPVTVQNGLPGTPNVHRFDIDMGSPLVDTIPKEANFFLVYDFYSQTGDQKYAAHTWRIWTGEFFPPSFTLPTKNAFDVELVVPVFLHGKLIIFGALNTPWGSYDVKPGATQLRVADGSGKEIEPRSIEVVNEYKFAHGAHYNPVNVSYIWNYQKDNLAPGIYTATISGSNQQGNAKASCTATFEVRPGGLPGDVRVGRCGLLTDTPASAPAAGGSPSQPGERRIVDDPLRGLPVDLVRGLEAQGLGVTPVGASPAALLATPLVAALAFLGVACSRRWGL